MPITWIRVGISKGQVGCAIKDLVFPPLLIAFTQSFHCLQGCVFDEKWCPPLLFSQEIAGDAHFTDYPGGSPSLSTLFSPDHILADDTDTDTIPAGDYNRSSSFFTKSQFLTNSRLVKQIHHPSVPSVQGIISQLCSVLLSNGFCHVAFVNLTLDNAHPIGAGTYATLEWTLAGTLFC